MNKKIFTLINAINCYGIKSNMWSINCYDTNPKGYQLHIWRDNPAIPLLEEFDPKFDIKPDYQYHSEYTGNIFDIYRLE